MRRQRVGSAVVAALVLTTSPAGAQIPQAVDDPLADLSGGLLLVQDEAAIPFLITRLTRIKPPDRGVRGAIVPSPSEGEATLLAQLPAAPAPQPGSPGPAGATAGVPSLALARGGPTASDLLDGYILPRIGGLAVAALGLQNAVIRLCATGTENAETEVAAALDAAAVAAARAVIVNTMRPDATDLTVRVLVPVADTETTSQRIDAISSGIVAAPADLDALALEEPGLTGLPALELLLRRIAVAPTSQRCILARAVSAHVRIAALRRERAFRAGIVAPHWVPSGETDTLAGRQRLRDLVEALTLSLDRMDRELASFATRPNNNRTLPFRASERMRAVLIAKTQALVDHIAVLRLYAEDGSEAAHLLAGIADTLGLVRRTLGELTGRDRPDEALTQLVTAQAVAVARLPGALGFDPSALRQPVGAYDPTTLRLFGP